MTDTDTRDPDATLSQIAGLHGAGCEIVRVAVPDVAAAAALSEITERSPLPVIADIHFDSRLAMAAIDAGVSALRVNPGNFGGPDEVARLADKAGEAGVPIRVGANSGSVKPALIESKLKAGLDRREAVAAALCESALEQCRLLEDRGFRDIKVSLKSSDVPSTLAAYERFAAETDYPLHIGVTEAGTLRRGLVKSAVGIGALLLRGIGDTLRVSLTADPVEEIRAALLILESCGLREARPEIVSCPGCGRTQINLQKLACDVESLIEDIKKEKGNALTLKKIAVMGCVVNGPGEAADADLGVTGGKGKVIIFKKGAVAGTYPEESALSILRAEIENNFISKMN
jgi:(E)-4-hydroxy-3-methylbut-2-enyl-diphosphate synthase